MIVTVDPHLILEPNRAHLRADGNRENVMQKNWYSSTYQRAFPLSRVFQIIPSEVFDENTLLGSLQAFNLCAERGEHFAARERLVAHGRRHRRARDVLQMLKLRGRVCSQAHPQQTTDPHISENRFSGLFGAALA